MANEPAFRRKGLSTAGARRLCEEILARGCWLSWNNSPDNRASRRVAEKPGFAWQRDERLYVVGLGIPTP